MRALRASLCTAGSCCLLFASASLAHADYPERTVEIDYGAAPGGTGDTIARMLAQQLSEKWGQPVVVVNRAGANHRIAADHVAHAEPDGYTILAMTGQVMLPDPPGVSLSYDLLQDFTPIALTATVPNCLAVNASLPVDTLQELIELAKAEPDTLNVAVVGTGGTTEVAMQRLLLQTGTTMAFLHYQGSSLGMAAILSNEAQIIPLPCASILSHLESGSVKVLATTERSTLPLLASVPTFEEASGIEDYDGGGSSIHGLAVPAGTPDDVVAKIREDVLEILEREDFRTQLEAIFITPASRSADFGQIMRSEVARWQAWMAEAELPAAN